MTPTRMAPVVRGIAVHLPPDYEAGGQVAIAVAEQMDALITDALRQIDSHFTEAKEYCRRISVLEMRIAVLTARINEGMGSHGG